MALDWLTRVNNQPAMLGIFVKKGHASNAAIRETGEFSVNIVLWFMEKKYAYTSRGPHAYYT